MYIRLSSLIACCALPGILAAQDLRIEHVQVASPERSHVVQDATVDISAGRITAITTGAKSARPAKAQVIDGHGLYLAPGLIDTHVHLSNVPGMTPEQERLHPDLGETARQQVPRSFLYFGYTTLIDLMSTPDGKARWQHQDLIPDTYFCGAAPVLDGYPMNYSPQATRYTDTPYFIVEPGSQATLPAGINAADHTPEAVVSRMKADGAICVKTFFDRGQDPRETLKVPRLETIRALVQAAHKVGLPVLLHASSTEAQTFGLDAGVDVMAHGLWNWGQEEAPAAGVTPTVQGVLDKAIQKHVGWQPTFRVGQGFRDLLLPSFLSDPMLARVLPATLLEWYATPEGQSFRSQLASGFGVASENDPKAIEARVNALSSAVFGKLERSTRYMAEHHGLLLFGTDTPCAPLFSNPPGLNGWWEMQSLAASGVSPSQIFRAATLDNARALKLDKDIGTVQVGKRANLLLLREDPTQTIQAYSHIDKVILGGRLLDPTELAANRSIK